MKTVINEGSSMNLNLGLLQNRTDEAAPTRDEIGDETNLGICSRLTMSSDFIKIC